jgi:alpha-ketoglutarate-dependent taurine dioxygenase
MINGAGSMVLSQHNAQLAHDGYSVIQAVDARDLLNIAAALGRPEPDPRDSVLVKDIRPQPSYAANTNTLSSRYGMGAFPLHTELAYLHQPPRFLLLYCVEPGRGRRTTALLDGAVLYSRLSVVGRPGTWVVKAGRRPFLCNVLWRRAQHQVGIRYDRECIFPRGRAALAEDHLIRTLIDTSMPVTIEWERRQLVIIDNWRMLHGRSVSKDDDRDRWLQRVLVSEA